MSQVAVLAAVLDSKKYGTFLSAEIQWTVLFQGVLIL